jgi:hypothetical protein
MFVSPTNFMMKGVAGLLIMSLGDPCCSMRPRLKMTTCRQWHVAHTLDDANVRCGGHCYDGD